MGGIGSNRKDEKGMFYGMGKRVIVKEGRKGEDRERVRWGGEMSEGKDL